MSKKISVSVLEKRVTEGIKWLDAVKPRWKKKIDLKKLDISGMKVCILGQVFGDFLFVAKIGYVGTTPKKYRDYVMDMRQTADRGFDFMGYEVYVIDKKKKKAQYKEFTDIWIKRIKELRK